MCVVSFRMAWNYITVFTYILLKHIIFCAQHAIFIKKNKYFCTRTISIFDVVIRVRN